MDNHVRTICPHCPPGSQRLFSQHGLKVHIGRMHKDLSAPGGLRSSAPIAPELSRQQTYPQHCCLDDLGFLKKAVPVLKHIPKAARSSAAGELGGLMDRCVECNSSEDWCSLLTFPYRALRVPAKAGAGNLTQKVKENIMSSDTSFPDDLTLRMSSGGRSLPNLIESKVGEGDLRGAVRLLVSDDAMAEAGAETLASLQSKHPAPSRLLVFPDPPGDSFNPLTVGLDLVTQALGSFHSGSAAGLDGLRPGHLKELTSGAAGDNGSRLLTSLTNLVNFILSGEVNAEICPYLYGASLCALNKKDGDVRPIAVGSTLRRLAAKVACASVRESMAVYLCPHQVGFGTRLGCEAAIHATRAFAASSNNSEKVIVKLDIKNAFNTLERDVLLGEVRENIPALYPFLFQVYHMPSHLFFANNLISSQVGVQQGDPLGPLIFSLCIQKVITDVKSPLNVWYLDDGTIGGEPGQVKDDLLALIPRLAELGLEVNSSKCEFFPCGASSSFPLFNSILPGLKSLTASSFSLLGSPIFSDGLPQALELRKAMLFFVRGRLKEISPHVALVLLRLCFAVPRVTYLLRTAPVWLCAREVAEFDETLKVTIEEILNVNLDETQWDQATLPIRLGGLGVRRVRDVGLPAFLASAHGVVGLVANILSLNGSRVCIPYAADAIDAWQVLNPGVDLPSSPCLQRMWDEAGVKALQERLVGRAQGADLARLRSVARPESGAWLQALPSPNLGTLLDGDSLRVAVALRLGCNVFEPHSCICGSGVEANGHHALSCCRCLGRFPRHHALNDIIRRALVSANVPCVLEPPGLSRTDGKRPDGLTLVPWRRGRCLIWDATCVNTFAVSHLPLTARVAGAAAEVAAGSKHAKYAPLAHNYIFVPVAVETSGSWGAEGLGFVREIGRRLRDRGFDPRSGAFLVQRLSIAVQRGNAACILSSFAPGTLGRGLFE